MWNRIKYYLGFTCIIQTEIGWFVTKRLFGIRYYKDCHDSSWWSIPSAVLKYAVFSTREAALQSVDKLKPKWQDI